MQGRNVLITAHVRGIDDIMKVDLGQNVRLFVSLWRLVVSSFVLAFRRFRTPISEVDSAKDRKSVV